MSNNILVDERGVYLKVKRDEAPNQKQSGSGVDWQSKLNGYMDQINNRKFDYNLNADKLYQQYRDQYTSMGKQAMADTMGQAASLTGGYGNTYAQSAGQQAYDSYLSQLNNKVPELYAQARASYDADTADLYNRYNLAMQGAQWDYQKQRDDVADQRYQTEWDYQTERDKVADRRYQNEWDYQKQRDTVADQRYQNEWDYQTERDKVADQRYQTEWEAKMNAEQYERERNDRLDAADQAYRDWQMGRADQGDARDIALMMIQAGKTPSADLLRAAGISAADAQTMSSYYANQLAAKYATASGSGGSGRSSGGSGTKSTSGKQQSQQTETQGVSNGDAYKEAKTAALLALQTGNVDYAIAGLDDYAGYLTNDQLNEIYAIVEKKFPGWKNPTKSSTATNKSSTVTKNNAAANSLYNAMLSADKNGVMNVSQPNKMLAKKK